MENINKYKFDLFITNKPEIVLKKNLISDQFVLVVASKESVPKNSRYEINGFKNNEDEIVRRKKTKNKI